MRTLKIMYFSCHEILEADDLRMFTDSGHIVFSLGTFSDPTQIVYKFRNPRPEYFNLQLWEQFNKMGCDLVAKRVTFEFCKLFDVIIVTHYAEWIEQNIEAFGDVPVIMRPVGQSKLSVEMKYKKFGDRINIVRYSDAELYISQFAKTDAVIYFGKNMDEVDEWKGDSDGVTFHNDFLGRKAIACPSLDMWRDFASRVPCQLYGANNEGIQEAKGVAPPDDMAKIQQNARFYFYIYTIRPSYTLSLIEAMLYGVPVLAPSASLVAATAYYDEDDAWTTERYEVPSFLSGGAGIIYGNVNEAVQEATRLRDDKEYAQSISYRGRINIRAKCNSNKIRQEWDDFFSKII